MTSSLVSKKCDWSACLANAMKRIYRSSKGSDSAREAISVSIESMSETSFSSSEYLGECSSSLLSAAIISLFWNVSRS